MAVRRLAFKWRRGFSIALALGCFIAPAALVSPMLTTPAMAAIEMGDVGPMLRPPPPPPSRYMSEADYIILDQAFEAVRRDNWRRALDLANQSSDPVGRDLILWLWAQDNDSDAPFAAIVQFMNEHPDWPRQSTLLRRAEEALPEEMPSDQVIAWFAGNEPVTGKGKLRLAAAYLELGNEAFATHWIRAAWIDHNFTRGDERRLLAEYGDYVDEASHIERTERLLWARSYDAASRMRTRVPSDYRRVIEARLSLMTLNRDASRRLAAVPENYENDVGIMYERTRWRRRQDRDEEAWAMIIAAPTTEAELGHTGRWWTERHIQARNALREGDPQSAYDMVVGHGMSHGGDFAEAEWLAGWIALRFLDRPEDALAHFVALEAGVSFPISRARALYWMGRATSELGLNEEANLHYRAAAEYPTTYYGQLAIERLPGGDGILRLPAPPVVDEERRHALRQEELVHAAELLNDLATERLTFAWFLHLGDVYDDPQDLQIIADMAREFDQWHMAVRVGKLAMFQHIYLTDTTYPLIEYNDLDVDIPLPEMALVLGLSRQESEFNPRALSPANAHGLMQLIPSTARTTARRMGLRYSTSWLRDNPTYNTELGRYHLGESLLQYDGSYIMTLAAYNAGPHRVTQWVQRYGDPRTDEVDPVDWVELLPFRETRNYIQRVLENTMIYRNRLTGLDLEVTMTGDLSRAAGQAPVMLAQIPVNALAVNDQPLELMSEEEVAEEIQTRTEISDELGLLDEGERVLIQINARDHVSLRGTRIADQETLLEPETQIWQTRSDCTAYSTQSNGDEEGSCEDS